MTDRSVQITDIKTRIQDGLDNKPIRIFMDVYSSPYSFSTIELRSSIVRKNDYYYLKDTDVNTEQLQEYMNYLSNNIFQYSKDRFISFDRFITSYKIRSYLKTFPRIAESFLYTDELIALKCRIKKIFAFSRTCCLMRYYFFQNLFCELYEKGN